MASQDLHSVDQNPAGIDAHWMGRQRLSGTGARDTFTILDTKQRGMGCTLNEGAIEIEELVRLPVERAAGVRAGILISMDRRALADDEDILHTISGTHTESARTGIA